MNRQTLLRLLKEGKITQERYDKILDDIEKKEKIKKQKIRIGGIIEF